MSTEVRLHPVVEDDIPVIEQLTNDPAVTGDFAWFGWAAPGRFRRRWEDNRIRGAEPLACKGFRPYSMSIDNARGCPQPVRK